MQTNSISTSTYCHKTQTTTKSKIRINNKNNRRPPLKFEDYILVSNNYFDKRWSGARRIKNVVMVLEWIPSLSVLSLKPPRDVNALDEKQESALHKAFALLDQVSSSFSPLLPYNKTLITITFATG